MTAFLKWLNKHEYAVHFLVMISVFYGISLGITAATAPSAVEALVVSFTAGMLLVLIGALSFRIATAVTDAIKSAVARAALAQLAQVRESLPPITDTIVDYTSTNVLVVKNVTDELKEAVSELKAAAEPPTEVAPIPTVEKKKRAPRAKSVKKES